VLSTKNTLTFQYSVCNTTETDVVGHKGVSNTISTSPTCGTKKA